VRRWKKWRRRELNEPDRRSNDLSEQQVTSAEPPLSAHCQHFSVPNSRKLTAGDVKLSRLVSCWSSLPRSIQNVIEALCTRFASATEGISSADSIRPGDNSELAEIVAAWATLLPDVRRAVLAIARLPSIQEGGQQQ
jgi:hypothetical protein